MNLASPGVVDPWKTIRRRRATAKDPPSPTDKNEWTPSAIEDVPQQAEFSAAKNSARPATAKDALVPTFSNLSPAPGVSKPSPSGNYDGFTVGIDEDNETGQPIPSMRGLSKRSNVRQKYDRSSAAPPLDSQAENEKVKTKLMICRGC